MRRLTTVFAIIAILGLFEDVIFSQKPVGFYSRAGFSRVWITLGEWRAWLVGRFRLISFPVSGAGEHVRLLWPHPPRPYGAATDIPAGHAD